MPFYRQGSRGRAEGQSEGQPKYADLFGNLLGICNNSFSNMSVEEEEGRVSTLLGFVDEAALFVGIAMGILG